jgi:hypoxanthine phosphoribosyltransferase
MNQVTVRGRRFIKSIDEKEIDDRVSKLAASINRDLEGEDVLFLGILNGSFIFLADLYREIDLESDISFLKLSSYEGLTSTGRIKELIGFDEIVEGRTVVVVEDIIDTGRTLNKIVEDLKKKGAGRVVIVTLLYKPEAYRGAHRIDYAGFEIPNDFVIGYGLDYDGLARNLRSIYRLAEE